MSSKLFTICSSVFLVFSFIVPGFADEHFPFLAEVSKESVNVRAGPNTNFEKIDKLSKGTKVVVLGRSYEWYKIQPSLMTKAYIRSDYLSAAKEGSIAVVEGDNVNVRSSPSSDAVSLGEVKKGTMVKVLGEAQGWSSLAPVAGTAAWIHQDFLTEISPDVPSSLLIQEIKEIPRVVVDEMPKVIVQTVSLQGTLEALPQEEAGDDVHYKIAIDDKDIYYLKDIPNISFFANTVVAVEGIVISDLLKKYAHPLLHINKIALVL